MTATSTLMKHTSSALTNASCTTAASTRITCGENTRAAPAIAAARARYLVRRSINISRKIQEIKFLSIYTGVMVHISTA